MENYVELMIPVALTLLQDHHPRVCYTALNFLEVLSVEWMATFQMKFHRWILPMLAKLHCHPNHHRNQMQQARSILHFCMGCTMDSLTFFLSDIVSKIQELCQSQSLMVQEWAVSALATVATSAQEEFSLFYDTAMHTLKGILMKPNEASRNNLCAKCLDSISTIAMVVGKETFAYDAFQVMELLILFLRSLEKSDHSIKIIIFQALQNIFNCLEQHFSVFLGDLMPLLLPSCKLFSGLANIKGENNSLLSKEHSLACEENAFACKLLAIFASELKEKYFPWIMMTAKTLVPMLQDFVEVRMEAAPVLPRLLESATLAFQKGVAEENTMSYVGNLANLFVPALLEAFGIVNLSTSQEPHIQLRAILFKSLRMFWGLFIKI